VDILSFEVISTLIIGLTTFEAGNLFHNAGNEDNTILQKQHVCLICMSSFSSSEGLKAHFKHHAEFLWEEDTEFPLECLAADPVEDEDPNTSQKNPIQRQQRLSESCDVLGTKYDFYALFLRTSLHILYKLF